MVPVSLLKEALDQLNKWDEGAASRVSSVDWRRGYQVRLYWYGNTSLVCYLDFKKDENARDALLQLAFKRFAEADQKPRRVIGHGWTYDDYAFSTSAFISINELADMARELGTDFTVLYVQECAASRPQFTTMGIGLVPGEMGKEWTGDAFIPYACPDGQNL